MKLLAATGNQGKIKELVRILSPLGIDVISPKEAGVCLDGIEETGSTFEENALIKAKESMRRSGMAVIADDSGLMVDALNGAPGVYSARYAGEHASDGENIEKLLRDMGNIPQEKRSARFVCTCCLLLPDGQRLMAKGTCAGTIGFTPKGTNGFGYDPVFLLEDGQSFAEITAEYKDKISHRGSAVRALARMIADGQLKG